MKFKPFAVCKSKLYDYGNLITLMLIFILLFSACKKNDLPYGSGTKLVKVIATKGDSVQVTTFDYDQMQRLASITHTTNNPGPAQTILLYYDAGKLMESEEVYSPANYSYMNSRAYYTYHNNRIIIKDKVGAFGETAKNKYSYNWQGKLIADTFYHSQLLNHSYISFRYNADKDVEEIQFFDNASGMSHASGTEKALYHIVTNPFSALGILYYVTNTSLYGDRITALSKNLIMQAGNGFGVTYYNYEYYPDGLPKKVLITSNYPGGTSLSIIDLFYK